MLSVCPDGELGADMRALCMLGTADLHVDPQAALSALTKYKVGAPPRVG